VVNSCEVNTTKKDKHIERAFYHWKTNLNILPYDNSLLKLKVNTLYIKFFDVDLDANTEFPVPVAQVRIKDTASLKTYKIIPVIFITNSCIRKLDSLSATSLADKITKLVSDICDMNGITWNEIQIDCDWTEATKNAYFILLQQVKKSLPYKELSATIRLYQVKYRSKTGVPPVDRGLLMAYNMGNLKDPSTANSILDPEELKKYTGSLSSYPLPLDVALPLFEWNVLFRNDQYAGLAEFTSDSFLSSPNIRKISGNRYRVLKDTVVNGYSFLKDDVLRHEESSYEEIKAAAKIISENISGSSHRLSLFHLDSLILKKYSIHELENIFNGLH
jgi:hypothetical protein